MSLDQKPYVLYDLIHSFFSCHGHGQKFSHHINNKELYEALAEGAQGAVRYLITCLMCHKSKSKVLHSASLIHLQSSGKNISLLKILGVNWM